MKDLKMEPKYISLYMDIAERISQMSHAKRLQVGSVIVKENTILSYGWNGMPAGWPNTCEYKEYKKPYWTGIDPMTFTPFDEMYPLEDEEGRYRWVTKPETLHAEMNALMKVAQSTESSTGATLFCTHAPCMDCAKAIYQAGISTVYYKETYRDDRGVKFLTQGGLDVHQHSNCT
jgi:dCMP deaminase